MFETYLLILAILSGFISSFMLGYIYVDQPRSRRALAVCGLIEGWKDCAKARLR